jgi:hypothetical protein
LNATPVRHLPQEHQIIGFGFQTSRHRQTLTDPYPDPAVLPFYRRTLLFVAHHSSQVAQVAEVEPFSEPLRLSDHVSSTASRSWIGIDDFVTKDDEIAFTQRPVRMYSIARSSTSSRPARTPASVGRISMSGTIPTRWVRVPSG